MLYPIELWAPAGYLTKINRPPPALEGHSWKGGNWARRPLVFTQETAVAELCGHAFSAAAISKGLDYFARGRVLAANAVVHRNDMQIRGTVQGSEQKPYLVEVR